MPPKKITQATLDAFWETDGESKGSHYETNYVNPVKRILGDTKDIKKTLMDFENVKKSIYERPGATNKNTHKFYLQALLYLIDRVPIVSKEVREKYHDEWLRLKTELTLEGSKKEYDEIDLNELQAKLDDHYGETSQEAIFLQFFRAVPLRLDFMGIRVFETKPKETPDTQKYLVLDEKKVYMISYNKTSKKFGSQDNTYDLTEGLIKSIKASLDKDPRNELFMFSNSNPTKAVKNIFSKIGHDINMNALRHNIANEVKDGTPEEKIELAKKMKHGVMAGEKYISQVKGDTVKVDVPRELEKDVLDFIKNAKSSG